MNNGMGRRVWSDFWRDGAEFWGLYLLAIGYPYVEKLSRWPIFFYDHCAGLGMVMLTGTVLFLVLPLALAGSLWLLHKGNQRLFRGVRMIYRIGMALLLWIYASKHLLLAGSIDVGWYWSMIAAGTAVLTALFCWRVGRDLLRLSMILTPLFWLYLVISLGGASQPPHPAARTAATIARPAPVVFIIADEFSLLALADRDWQINARQFPHLAALAQQSCWYRHARTVAGYTLFAVPAMLTGTAVQLKPIPDATLYNYPKNLFTMLPPSWYVNIREWRTMTALSPWRNEVFFLRHYWASVAKLGYFFYTKELPVMRFSWEPKLDWEELHRVPELTLAEWTARLRGGRSLNYFHMKQPHYPLTSNWDGRSYDNFAVSPGIPETQTDNREVPCLINLVMHQYLLQCGNVDREIGRVVEALKARGIFDQAMIVLVGDHGTAFHPGVLHRGGISEVGLASVGFVPLLIKFPGQQRGEVSDRQATSIDLLPTICGVWKTPPPWPMDGSDLAAATFPTFDYDWSSKRVFYNYIVEPGARSHYADYTLNEVSTTFRRLLERKNNVIDDRLSLADAPANYTGDVRYQPLLTRKAADFAVTPLPEAVITANLSHGMFLSAALERISPVRAALPLAIAVNGEIRVITRAEKWQQYPYFFAAMFPRGDATPGSLSYYLLDDRTATPKLYHLTGVKYQTAPLLELGESSRP